MIIGYLDPLGFGVRACSGLIPGFVLAILYAATLGRALARPNMSPSKCRASRSTYWFRV